MKKQIQILDVTSPKIQSLLIMYERSIHAFIEKMNTLLPTDFRPNLEKGIFELVSDSERDWAYEDDGNTRCDALRYDAIWSFPLCEISEYRIGAVRDGYRGYAAMALHFHFDARERVHEGELSGSWFFDGFLSKVEPLDRYHGNDEHHIRFAMENNNYAPASTLTTWACAQLIKEILGLRQIYDAYKVLEGAGEPIDFKIAHHVQRQLDEADILNLSKILD